MHTVTWTTLRGSPVKQVHGRSPPMTENDAEQLVRRILREDPIATAGKFPLDQVGPLHLSLRATTWKKFNNR